MATRISDQLDIQPSQQKQRRISRKRMILFAIASAFFVLWLLTVIFSQIYPDTPREISNPYFSAELRATWFERSTALSESICTTIDCLITTESFADTMVVGTMDCGLLGCGTAEEFVAGIKIGIQDPTKKFVITDLAYPIGEQTLLGVDAAREGSSIATYVLILPQNRVLLFYYFRPTGLSLDQFHQFLDTIKLASF